ncbi:MAG TPA: LUD domain-containing protein [Candidatus Limnocylindrales bacterium]|nr:LUD domain-containing protein [Candidatus Limnocylindrales bacterium]
MSERIVEFEAKGEASAATVERVTSAPVSVRAAVERIVGPSAKIVLGPDEFLPREIWQALRELPGLITEPTDKQLSTADVGISGAFAGVSSSGSVCIAMGPPLAAAASLLMPLHIVVVSPERIVARPRDLFDPECLGGEGLRRDLVFITGPSATADMGPLVRGVHGPHRLHILLLG